MCEWGTTTTVEVTMQPFQDSEDHFCRNNPEDHRCKGEWKKQHEIDSCIADIIDVFEYNDIHMLASCCGHGEDNGYILLLKHEEIIIPIKLTTN